MKKFLAVVGTLMILVGVANIVYAEFKRFDIYTDSTARGSHYVPSGWMGDYGDMKFDRAWKENPHSGTTCIKIVYSAEQKQGAGWAGIYWQNPANNWGTKPGGFDLTGAKKLVFSARGGKGGEVLSEVGIGGISDEYSDSDKVSVGPIALSTEWKKHEIDLRGKDLSYISGGFFWSANAQDNSEGFTIYFDDIYYE